MKRFLLLAALSVASFACGSSSSDDTESPGRGAETGPGTPDAIPGTPTDKDLDEEHGIFVSPTGKDSAAGTREAPLATLQAAITAVGKSGKSVYACEGTYAETLEVVNGVHMVGGITCKDGLWSFGNARSKISSATSPAMHAKDITALTRIAGFEVIAPDGNDTNPSSIGLIAENSKGLTLANMRIAAGKGLAGTNGTQGTQLNVVFAPPQNGRGQAMAPCSQNGPCTPRPGGTGGSSTCTGEAGFTPGSGGHGGSSGVWVLRGAPDDAFYITVMSSLAESRPGTDGVAGTDGTSATQGSFDPSGYVPGSGTVGTNGAVGTGGRGGEGSPPTDKAAVTAYNLPLYGNDGAGGGAGGCPGLAGTPGTGGGASVAALLFDSAIAIDGSELASADGGAGGLGTTGSDATYGGHGGNGTAPSSAGVNGGNGGRAGISGHGSGGPSFAIAYRGGPPKVDGKSTLSIGKGGIGREALTVSPGGVWERTIPASGAGEASQLHSF